MSMPLTGKIVINIPKDRIGVLIGPDGVTKRRIEREFHVKLTVNSETGEVAIEPIEGCSLPDILKARKVVEAIGYGFNPDIALKLREDDVYLEVIDLKEYFKRREDLVRVKARIIGTEGKARRMIEELSNAHIVIGDRYVAILGTYEQVRMARDAVMRLISGAQHRTVYARLRRMRRELKRQKFWEMLEKAKEAELSEGLEEGESFEESGS